MGRLLLFEFGADMFAHLSAADAGWCHLFGGRLLGATIVAPRAGEMINEVALMMRLGAFTGRLAQTTHAYPSWAHGLQKAAAQFVGEVEGRAARRARG